MKKRVAIALLWVACGFYNWGSFLAACPHEFPYTYHAEGIKGFYVSSFFMALTGPVGAVMINVEINPLNLHGWRLR